MTVSVQRSQRGQKLPRFCGHPTFLCQRFSSKPHRDIIRLQILVAPFFPQNRGTPTVRAPSSRHCPDDSKWPNSAIKWTVAGNIDQMRDDKVCNRPNRKLVTNLMV